MDKDLPQIWATRGCPISSLKKNWPLSESCDPEANTEPSVNSAASVRAVSSTSRPNRSHCSVVSQSVEKTLGKVLALALAPAIGLTVCFKDVRRFPPIKSVATCETGPLQPKSDPLSFFLGETSPESPPLTVVQLASTIASITARCELLRHSPCKPNADTQIRVRP